MPPRPCLQGAPSDNATSRRQTSKCGGFLVVARFLIQPGTAKIRKVLKMEIKQVNLDICDNEGYSRYSYL